MRALYPVLYPALLGAGKLAGAFSPKIRRGFQGRRGLVQRIEAHCSQWEEGPLWFHAASAGEIEQCLPILDAIRAKRPATRLFLSYFSPSAERAVALEERRRASAGKLVPWDYADYSPYDLKRSVRRYLDALRPRSLTAIHREIWPGIIEECVRREIPCRLFAAHLPPGNKSRRWVLRFSPWLRDFSFVGTTGPEGARLFVEGWPASVPCPTVAPLGDPRIERVLSRKAMGLSPAWAPFFQGQRVLIFASVWEEDFKEITRALGTLLAGAPDLRLVIVPHEPREPFVEEILESLRKRGLSAKRWSRWREAPDKSSSLVVDGVGFLAELYRVATAVFVGGSFQKRVHNVIEPAGYGKPVFTGPYIKNSGEACELERSGLLRSAPDGESLASEILKLLSDPLLVEERGRRLEAYLNERTGAGGRYADMVLSGL